MICIKCNKPEAHRSHRNSIIDWWYRLFQMTPYRCQACKARFYAYRSGEKSAKMRTAEERKIIELRRRMRWKHAKKELAVYVLGIAIMISVVYLLMQPRFE